MKGSKEGRTLKKEANKKERKESFFQPLSEVGRAKKQERSMTLDAVRSSHAPSPSLLPFALPFIFVAPN